MAAAVCCHAARALTTAPSFKDTGVALKRSPMTCTRTLSSCPRPRHPIARPVCRRRALVCQAEAEATVTTAAPEDGTVEDEVPIEQRPGPYPTVMDIEKIREILPHRYPFLLVDRIIEYTPGETAVGIKNVTVNDNFFTGHFPGRAIMPGVLQVEALAQLGGIVMLQPEEGGSKEIFFFGGVDGVRWRKPVVPGDTLVMRMTLTRLQKRFGVVKMAGKAYVDGQVVCEGDFTLIMAKPSS